jgi:predicted MPP superfamily phosphohydrolase
MYFYAVSIVWLCVLCVGHIALLSYSNNWWFAQALPHRFLQVMRLLHGFLVAAGVVILCRAYALHRPLPIDWNAADWRQLVAAGYALACTVVGAGVVPAVTIYRLLTPLPKVLQSNHSAIVDVAAGLGYKPVGRGKYRIMAHMPGNQVFQVEFAERTLCLPRLPVAWDGLSILHLSDLHLCGTPDKVFYQRVMERCREWDPDLIAFTGDLVDSHHHHNWIIPILGRLRWRIAAFGILGNHDSWHEPHLVRRRLARLGFHVLDNSWEQIRVRGEPLLVIGHEGPWFQPEPDLKDCPVGPFRLCLSHTPDNLPWARQHGMDLVLAGHNHGGQIRFPVLGSVLVPSRFSRRYDCGIFDEPPSVLHVSRGLAGQHPLRYNCRPEVTKIVLQARHRD